MGPAVGRCSVGEVTIDLALIQKPARTPDKTPLQTVVHRIASQDEGSALALLFCLSFQAPR